jgi:hypothetical protein
MDAIHVYLIWSECELVQSMTILGKRWVNKAIYLRELHKPGDSGASAECSDSQARSVDGSSFRRRPKGSQQYEDSLFTRFHQKRLSW